MRLAVAVWREGEGLPPPPHPRSRCSIAPIEASCEAGRKAEEPRRLARRRFASSDPLAPVRRSSGARGAQPVPGHGRAAHRVGRRRSSSSGSRSWKQIWGTARHRLDWAEAETRDRGSASTSLWVPHHPHRHIPTRREASIYRALRLAASPHPNPHSGNCRFAQSVSAGMTLVPGAGPMSHFPQSATCQEPRPWRASEGLSELAAQYQPQRFSASRRPNVAWLASTRKRAVD